MTEQTPEEIERQFEPAGSEQPVLSGEQIQSDSLPCDIRFYGAANEFAKQALKDVAELQAVAIIPLWNLQDVPNGLLRLRDENAIYLPSLLKMMAKITAFSSDIHQDMIVQLRVFDRMSSETIKELNDARAELEAVTQAIAQQKAAETE